MLIQLIHVVGEWLPVPQMVMSLLCKLLANKSITEKNKIKNRDNLVYYMEKYCSLMMLDGNCACLRGLPSLSLSGTLSPGIGNLTNLQSV